jgi:MFS family permease
MLCVHAAVGCGLSPNYWVLIGCRMLVGVGEASFVALAAPFIGEAMQINWQSHSA